MLYVFSEHAIGYALFEVAEFEEIGTFLAQVECSVTDLSRFNKIVKLSAFVAFDSALDALEAINTISEGIAPDGLKSFLDVNFPKSKKTANTLGVNDKNLAANITETLGMKCVHKGVVPEVVRGIRYHFFRLVKGVDEDLVRTAQLGLGHSYSRAKVKFNVHRVDNNIIHSIALVDMFDKNINKFSMRMREWYSYHFPELYKIVPDNYLFARTVQFVANRRELTEDKLEELEEIVMDSAKARAILDAARSSMGMDIAQIDLDNALKLTHRIIALVDCRNSMNEYLKNVMTSVAPNLSALLGEQVGARMISQAGSLTKLAKCPASTVQILGAEKALFRALKTRSNTPKYGILFNSSYIGRASAQNKGRISRFVANKCSIAARIDCFSESSSNIFGEKLRQQVENRLTFFETGTLPPRNVDVMKEAVTEWKEHQEKAPVAEMTDTSESGKKKKKKRSHVESVIETEDVLPPVDESIVDLPPKKNKKKKKNAAEDDETENGFVSVIDESPIEKTKKKKKKRFQLESEFEMEEFANVDESVADSSPKKNKKEKNLTDADETENGFVSVIDESLMYQTKKKKKKKKDK